MSAWRLGFLAFAWAMAGWGGASAQADGSMRWSFATQGLVFSSPAVAPDGTIYIGSESKRLWAVNPDGSFKWRWPATLISTADWFDASPSIASDGTIYAPNFDGKLYALNPNGSLKWSYDTSSYIISSVAIAEDGTLYFGAGDGSLHAVNPDGTVKWLFTTGDWVDSSPAIGGDGIIFFGSWDSNVYAVHPDGSEKWVVATGDAVQSSPAIGPDGTVYVGSGDGRLYAITAAGAIAWTFQTDDTVDSHPVIGPDGKIYFGSSDGNFHALKPDGTPAWPAPYNVGQGVFGGAVIRADGTIIFGASDRRVHALNADGTVKWTYTTGDVVDSSPALAADGTIYAGSYDNKLYALHGNGGGVSVGAWPKFRRDARNQGSAPEAAPVVAPTFLASPLSQTVEAGAAVTFSVVATGTQPLVFEWLKNEAEIDDATLSSLTIAPVSSSDAGTYRARVSNAAGMAISEEAFLMVNPAIAPSIALQPRQLTVVPGGKVSLWVEAEGSAPLRYQWSKDGVPIAGATGKFLELSAAESGDAGDYTVVVSNAGGSIASDLAVVAVDPVGSSRLINLSTRAFVGTGGSVLIPGFVVSGTSPQALLVRAVGPALAGFGVDGAIVDPELIILSGDTSLHANDNWSLAPNASEIAAQTAAVGAFDLEPGSGDAAALVELAPGEYTVQVSGVEGDTGISLVEVYAVGAVGATDARLVNISTRADVGPEDAVMIPGFVIEGTAAKTLLIRAVGPSLSGFGVGNFLVDPVLRLFEGENEILANGDWSDAPDFGALAAATSAVGAFSLENESADAVMLVVLMPGTYTAQASGVDEAIGNVLVEVYEAP